MNRFEDRVVLITGAASGIGQAAAVRLAQEGGKIYCTDINETALDETVVAIKKAGGEATARKLDISSESDVNACVQECVKTYGKLDAVVNMAGILRFDNCHELELSNWQRVIDVNLTGTFLLCKAV
ncbi:MAG: NAD(P)-dependent dehydrogenase (short-subunit alcohol dehydrogenase family) [Bacteroidia bacterium]|jgi:NAD(P)-dependent dehydrogenase (short-subunit alcohol dehydrogenase family)